MFFKLCVCVREKRKNVYDCNENVILMGNKIYKTDEVVAVQKKMMCSVNTDKYCKEKRERLNVMCMPNKWTSEVIGETVTTFDIVIWSRVRL